MSQSGVIQNLSFRNKTASRQFRAIATVFAFLVTFVPQFAEARMAPVSFADLAEQVLPGVVNINVTKSVGEQDPRIEEFFKRFAPEGAQPAPPKQRSGGGTGFIVDESGIIVTNNHVIEDADEIMVRLNDGGEFPAELIGTDPKTDIAVIRIKTNTKLPAVKFGDSEASRVGDWVLTIGSPFGLGGSVTAGIISAYNRDINTGLYDDYIQTDAPINPGNSGGPMFNLDGEVIGINTAIFSPSGGNNGIGFAIPSNLAKRITNQLIEKGSVQRGWLGVAFQPVTSELAEGLGLADAKGVLVASVNDGSPAAEGGILSGDVIVKYDGTEIDSKSRLPGLVADTPIGKKVPVIVLRKGKEKKLTVTIIEREEEDIRTDGELSKPDEKAKADGIVVLGMVLEPLSIETRKQLDVAPDVEGVVIADISVDSPARAKGLTKGDIIVAVAQEDVKSPKDVEKLIAAVREKGLSHALLRIYRSGNYTHVAISLTEKQDD